MSLGQERASQRGSIGCASTSPPREHARSVPRREGSGPEDGPTRRRPVKPHSPHFLAATLSPAPVLAQPAPAPAPARAASPARGSSPRKLLVLKEIEDVVARYGEAEDGHRGAMQGPSPPLVRAGLLDIGERYSKGIAASEKDFARVISRPRRLLAFPRQSTRTIPNGRRTRCSSSGRSLPRSGQVGVRRAGTRWPAIADPEPPDADDFDALPSTSGPRTTIARHLGEILTGSPTTGRSTASSTSCLLPRRDAAHRRGQAAYLGLSAQQVDPLATARRPDPASLRSRMNVAPIVAGDPYEGGKPMKESPI